MVVFNLQTLKLIMFWNRLENTGNGHQNCFQISYLYSESCLSYRSSVVPVGCCVTMPTEVRWGAQSNIKLVRSGPVSALLRSATEAGPFSPEAVGSASLEISTSTLLGVELGRGHPWRPLQPKLLCVALSKQFLGTETAVYYGYLVSTIGLLV